MKEKELDKIIESLLFASSDPLSQTLLNQVFDKPFPNLNKTVNAAQIDKSLEEEVVGSSSEL